MKINFLGDSITQGAGANCEEETYVYLVGKMLGCEAMNYGIGGTRIARQTTPSTEPIYDQDFLTRCEKMEDADFVVVFGGTNDYGHGDAEIGEEDSFDEYTFCGAVNSLIKKLSARYGKNKICFILPLHRFNEDNPYGEGNKPKAGQPLCVYVQKLRTLLEKQGVKYFDFGENFPIPQTNQGDAYTVDGLHPNPQGHRFIAEKLSAYVRTCL